MGLELIWRNLRFEMAMMRKPVKPLQNLKSLLQFELMKIEFDASKNDWNLHQRSLSFKRAADFDFNTAIVQQDVRKPYPEVRFVALGFLDARLHVLCFTPMDAGIRVISFRKANPREIKNYEQAHPTH